MQLDQLLKAASRFPKSSVTEVRGDGTNVTITFAEVTKRAKRLADSLSSSRLREGDIVAIQGPNCLAWMIWDLALTHLGCVTHVIPEEATAGNGFIPWQQSPHALIVGDSREWFEGAPRTLLHEDNDAEIFNIQQHPPAACSDVHSLVYSSGTTGRLKGLSISRRGTETVVQRFGSAFTLGPQDSHIIFLPLSNYQQRLSIYGCLWYGASIVICPYQRAFQTIREFSPTFLIGPPAFYENVFRLAGGHRGITTPKLMASLGGSIRFLITGMAPIRRVLLDAFWQANVPLLEAYGTTEAGMIAWNTPQDHRVGTVGHPVARDEIVFEEDGEIVVRSRKPLSLGYFSPECDETFRTDGLIATGDLGAYDPDGYIVLKGRKKDIIVLASGLKVHPEDVEVHLRQVEAVKEVAVVGNAAGDRLIGLIVCDPSREARVRADIATLNHALPPHLCVSKLLFTDQDFSGNSRFLTRNLKLNRLALAQHINELMPRVGRTPAEVSAS